MAERKILITYFSAFPEQDKFTEQFARIIAENTGGTLAEIKCATAYPKRPEEYPQIERIAYEELHANARPDIVEEIPVADYDTIFVGYPIWCYTLPQVMFTFLERYDFAGKTVIPFNTHEGSGDGGTYETVRKWIPDATVLQGLAIRDSEIGRRPEAQIKQWLASLAL